MLQDIRDLLFHLSPLRRLQLALLAVFMLVGALFEILTVGLLFPFVRILSDPGLISEALVTHHLRNLLGGLDHGRIVVLATLLFSLVVLVSSVIRLALSYAILQVGNTIGHDLSINVFRKILAQPYAHHIRTNSSEILSVVEISNNLSNRILTPCLQFCVAAVISGALLAGLVFVGLAPALVIGAFAVAFYFSITWLSRRLIRRASGVILRAQGRRILTVQEASGNIRDVVISNLRATYLRRFIASDLDLKRAMVSSGFVGAAPRYAIEAVGTILIAILACAVALRPGGIGRSLPLLASLALGAQKLIPNLHQMFSNWTTIATNHRGLKAVLERLDLPPGDDKGDDQAFVFERDLVLDEVTFAYGPDLPNVLNGFSAVIPKGARVGIVGKTGVGKSTLVDIVMGLLEPVSGEVRVDGRAVTAANVGAWRRKISQVPQSVYLSDSSIAQNITLSADEADIDWPQLRRSARMAQIDGFVCGLPEQYDTLVGERGVRLSGGQRQRLGIARALYRKAELIVLDEATSALDSETQADLLAALRDIGPEVTIIMIAHRLSTLADCDLILDLDQA